MKLQRLAWTLFICLLFAIHGNGQKQDNRPANPAQQNSHVGPPMPGDTVNETQDRLTREMAKKANLERHAALKTDTDKLFKLAEELKDSVDKSSASVLSVEVVKKAEEIEKLAHSVKDKMRGPN